MNVTKLLPISTRGGFALAVIALAVSGCANLPAGQTEPVAASTPPATDSAKIAAAVAAGVTAGNAAGAKPGASPASVAQAAGAAAAAAVGPKPFADVIKDAKETKGLFAIWQKDEKVWIEIAPEQFGKPYLFTANLSRGVGEKGVYGGMMLRAQTHIVEFKRIGNSVQLIAKNQEFTGGANAAIAQGVKEGFTDSLIGATTVASQPHPDRKTVLIDVNALLLTDIPVGSGFTRRPHAQLHVRREELELRLGSDHAGPRSFIVAAHYTNPKATLPPVPTPTPPPPNPFPPFENLPDARSLFLGLTYNIATLPDAMPTRRADPRVGHFATSIWDFSTDKQFTAKTNYVDRWRLEKKDPSAAVSEPKEPIVFWIDRNVPDQYRAAVRAGILEWNKAFEKAGFKDAIVVRQQEAGRHVRYLRFPALDGAMVRGHRRRLRHRPVDDRPPHRRNSRCAGRNPGGVVAHPAHVHHRAGAWRVARVRRVQGLARPRRPGLHLRDRRARRNGVRPRPARGARRDRAGEPRGRSLRQRRTQGGRDA